MRFSRYSALFALSVLLCGWALAGVVAVDNADFPAYAPQPNNNWATTNGGSGYKTWTLLDNTAGGATFMGGLTNTVEGSWSFGLNSSNGPIAVSRALISQISGFGQFDLLTRFAVANGTNLFSLRADNVNS